MLVDGEKLRPKDKVLGGEQVRVSAVVEEVAGVEPEQIELDIVHQDRHVLVLNKPAGLVVHPGAGNAAGTLQNALLHLDPKLAQVPRAGIVHRLDKDTSGLMVVARTLEAHTALVRAIEAREVEREYEAVCMGVMTGGGVVDAPIGRHPVDRVRMSIREDGREAVTHYRVLHRYRASHACAFETGVRAHAPDPRAHGAHPLSDRRRSRVRRAAAVAEGCFAAAHRSIARVSTSGAARRESRVRASGEREADPLRSAVARRTCRRCCACSRDDQKKKA